MTFLSGGDMWRRVSQRQICARVCHPKWPPQCVSLTGKRDTKMIKQPRVYVKLGPAMGATGGHRWLDGVELCRRKSARTLCSALQEVKGGIRAVQNVILRHLRLLLRFSNDLLNICRNISRPTQRKQPFGIWHLDCFEASSLDFSRRHLVFLETEVTIFGKERR